MTHTLIWKSPRAPASLGANPLLGWQRFELWDSAASHFKKVGSPAPLAGLAIAALDGAIATRRDVTVAQQVDNPETTPAVHLLLTLMGVRPVTLICPERATSDAKDVRWILALLTGATSQEPPSVPEVAIQAAVDAHVKGHYPVYNQAPPFFSVAALLLRHQQTAEGLGLVPPEEITPDSLLGSIAADPDVREATARWDRATPSTHYELARARDEAQARIGIPEADRAFLYSSEVDSEFVPIVMRMGRGNEAATAQMLKRSFAHRYRELGPPVLAFCLRTYRHGNIDSLRQAAGITAHVEAA
jgi:hypothetical protein